MCCACAEHNCLLCCTKIVLVLILSVQHQHQHQHIYGQKNVLRLAFLGKNIKKTTNLAHQYHRNCVLDIKISSFLDIFTKKRQQYHIFVLIKVLFFQHSTFFFCIFLYSTEKCCAENVLEHFALHIFVLVLQHTFFQMC